jgi:hypothetical protein
MVRYRVLFLDTKNRDYKDTERQLNEAAAEGWELVEIAGDRAIMVKRTED